MGKYSFILEAKYIPQEIWKKKKKLITKISDRSSFQWFFFTFIRFPALLLVKTIDSYLHEFCARGILLAISVTWRNVKEHAIESRVTSL